MKRKLYQILCMCMLIGTAVPATPIYCAKTKAAKTQTQTTTTTTTTTTETPGEATNKDHMVSDLYRFLSEKENEPAELQNAPAEIVIGQPNLVYQVQSDSDKWNKNDTLFHDGIPITRYYWDAEKGPNCGGVFVMNGLNYVISSDSGSSFTISSDMLTTYVNKKQIGTAFDPDATYTISFYPYLTSEEFAKAATASASTNS